MYIIGGESLGQREVVILYLFGGLEGVGRGVVGLKSAFSPTTEGYVRNNY